MAVSRKLFDVHCWNLVWFSFHIDQTPSPSFVQIRRGQVFSCWFDMELPNSHWALAKEVPVIGTKKVLLQQLLCSCSNTMVGSIHVLFYFVVHGGTVHVYVLLWCTLLFHLLHYFWHQAVYFQNRWWQCRRELSSTTRQSTYRLHVAKQSHLCTCLYKCNVFHCCNYSLRQIFPGFNPHGWGNPRKIVHNKTFLEHGITIHVLCNYHQLTQH